MVGGTALVILLALAGAAASLATVKPTGADFRVSNAGTEGNPDRGSFNPKLAYNPNANQYLVVWEEYGATADRSYDIYGQLLSAGGQEVGSDFRISNAADVGSDREAFDPEVSYDTSSNEYLVVWSGDELATDDEFEVFGQRISSAGAAVGSDFRISNVGTDTDTDRGAFDAAINVDPAANRYLVTWQGDQAADDQFDIYGQLVSGAGAAVGSDFRISNATDVGSNRDAQAPVVAYDASAGEYVVVWTADQATTDEQEGVFLQRVSAAGAPAPQGDVEVSNFGSDGDPFTRAFEPGIAYNSADHRSLVVWEGSAVGANHTREVFGQLVNSGGTKSGGYFGISDTGAPNDTTRDPYSPTATYSAASNQYVVVWEADGEGSDEEFEISGSAVAAAGDVDIPDFRVSHIGSDGNAARDAFDAAIAYNSSAKELLVNFTGDGLATNDEFETYGHRLLDLPTAGKCKGKTATVPLAAGGKVTKGTKRRDVIAGNGAANKINSRGGNDLVCAGGGKDKVKAGGGNDQVLGGAGKDTLLGQGGKDTLLGQGGRDRLLGGGARDKLFGGPAADFIRGGPARDKIVGGPGRDNEKQ
jgi:hypothetical protein